MPNTINANYQNNIQLVAIRAAATSTQIYTDSRSITDQDVGDGSARSIVKQTIERDGGLGAPNNYKTIGVE